ncbi:MAG: response regulator [Ardenticatenaceae bacterium]|nr:response regulator [Ardenticatenaceae bacterium]
MTGALLKILLVEDNPAHAELIIRSLEDHKVPNDIYHAYDGEVALDYLFQRGPYNDALQNPRPHVILLDIRMPKIDGIQVLKEIKASTELKHIPVIILTTSEAEADVQKAYQNYANSYLVKPVDFDEFMQLMDELGFYWLNWNHHQLS